ncbi:MAG TPA: YHS domain-containing protein, partial [Pyrinomonadaceae bacterium]|nr:YHS domain-containing protein [Pyrinomonadaceae bacterium]
MENKREKTANLVQLGRKASEPAAEPHIDPVCKMLVMPETAAASYEHEGTIYYFCMPGCKAKFATDPDRYLNNRRDAESQSPETHDQSDIPNPNSQIEFTCPMHPEVVQIGPGSCPFCGMALEPKEISLDDTP